MPLPPRTPADTPDLIARVSHLETGQAQLALEVGNLRMAVVSIGTKIDDMASALSATQPTINAAQQDTIIAIRDEQDRRARDRGEMFKNGLALLGGMSIVAGALFGPYIGRISSLEDARDHNIDAIVSIRSTIAEERVAVQRNRDTLNNLSQHIPELERQDDDFRDRLARIEGRHK